MKLEIVAMPGGTTTLSGLRYVPERNRRDTALVLAHGFSSGKYSMDTLASYLAQRGYEALTFDFVGHKLGGSGGSMDTILRAPQNLRDALHWMRRNTTAARIVLIGHSMGAAAALQVAAWEGSELPDPGEESNTLGVTGAPPALAGVIAMCMGTHPSRGFDSTLGRAMVEQRQDYVAGAPTLQLLQEIDALALAAENIGMLPTLFIAARQDILVSVERVQALAALAPNSAVEVIESSHLEAPDRSRAAIYTWLAGL